MAENEEVVEMTQEELDEQHRVRLEKLRGLKDAGKDPYTITKFPVDIYNSEIRERFEELENKDVVIAGRMMSRRIMGKASFFDVRDSSDRMQVYVRIDGVGEDKFAEFKKWDLGDIIGVKGYVFKTKTGEISVHATEITLLSKSLLPLPEKWHGLKDKEERYRKRYLDLIANPDVKGVFVKRSRILSEIRKFLDGHGYVEVDTPVLLPLEIGAAARPFKT
ncbi:MAG: lysine--tRNA ligase, partial [Oscillospiraceae bacterium]|nr:lysine--tRNA ligase [Oscillospiraceae bacterium]